MMTGVVVDIPGFRVVPENPTVDVGDAAGACGEYPDAYLNAKFPSNAGAG